MPEQKPVPMQMLKVLSRSTVHPAISMWGTLHANQLTGALVGWIVDTWSEPGVMPPLHPRMHWVPRQDGKFYRMRLNIDYRCTVEFFGEDTEIEPHRAAFIRATLAIWEEQYLEEKARGVK